MANDQEVKYLVPGLEAWPAAAVSLWRAASRTDLCRAAPAGGYAEGHRLPRGADHGVYGLSGRNTRTNTFSLGMNVLRLGFEVHRLAGCGAGGSAGD